jgi:hypothetical protein
MPELQRLADDLQGERFALLTVNLQEDAGAITPYRQELGLRLPVLLDEDGSVTNSYGVRGLPATFLDRPAGHTPPAAIRSAGRWQR